MPNTDEKNANIEATTLRMFSVFFAILSALVFAGSYFAREKTPTLITSLATGLVLAIIAVVARFVSSRIKIHQ